MGGKSENEYRMSPFSETCVSVLSKSVNKGNAHFSTCTPSQNPFKLAAWLSRLHCAGGAFVKESKTNLYNLIFSSFFLL